MHHTLPPAWQPYARPPLLGAAFGLLLVLGSIAVGAKGFTAFFSLEGLLIVGGGVVAVAWMSYPAMDVRAALNALKDLFAAKEPEDATSPDEALHDDMQRLIAWARLIKEKGLRSLEATLAHDTALDSFVKYGLNMVVSDYTPLEVRDMMETAADARADRASVPVEVLDSMAGHAPAFGMVGTLVGMIIMLSRLSDDNLTAIGASLGVAFLSTLYGVMSARLLFMPAATHLRQKVEDSRFHDQLIVEGMVMLASGKPPMHIQDRLNSFLRPESHDYYNVFVTRPATPLRAAS